MRVVRKGGVELVDGEDAHALDKLNDQLQLALCLLLGQARIETRLGSHLGCELGDVRFGRSPGSRRGIELEASITEHIVADLLLGEVAAQGRRGELVGEATDARLEFGPHLIFRGDGLGQGLAALEVDVRQHVVEALVDLLEGTLPLERGALETRPEVSGGLVEKHLTLTLRITDRLEPLGLQVRHAVGKFEAGSRLGHSADGLLGVPCLTRLTGQIAGRLRSGKPQVLEHFIGESGIGGPDALHRGVELLGLLRHDVGDVTAALGLDLVDGLERLGVALGNGCGNGGELLGQTAQHVPELLIGLLHVAANGLLDALLVLAEAGDQGCRVLVVALGRQVAVLLVGGLRLGDEVGEATVHRVSPCLPLSAHLALLGLEAGEFVLCLFDLEVVERSGVLRPVGGSSGSTLSERSESILDSFAVGSIHVDGVPWGAHDLLEGTADAVTDDVGALSQADVADLVESVGERGAEHVGGKLRVPKSALRAVEAREVALPEAQVALSDGPDPWVPVDGYFALSGQPTSSVHHALLARPLIPGRRAALDGLRALHGL